MSTGLLDAVGEIFRKKEQRAAADFDALVKAFDDESKPPKPAWIAEQLERLAETPAELESTLEYRRNRLGLRAKLATLPQLQGELADVQAVYTREMEKWGPVEQSHKSTILQCEVEANRLETAIADCKSMESKLRAGYQGGLLDELAAISIERQQVWREQQAVASTREHHHRELTCYRSPEHPLVESAKVSMTKIVADCDAKLAELGRQTAALDWRQQEIEAAMVEP